MPAPRGLWRRVAAVVAAHVAESGMLLASWICLGYGALSGRLDLGWMAGWALALASTVPLRSLSTWLQGTVALGWGAWIKRRLLIADLHAGPDGLADRGLARSMSDLLETAAIDDLAACGGIEPLLAGIELAVVPPLMVAGRVTPAEIAVTIGVACLTIGALAQNLRRREAWARLRLASSASFIDDQIACRTRAVQSSAVERHAADDAMLGRYVEVSRSLDESTARIESMIPRAYLITAVLALAPDFAAGTASPANLAITLGLVLFARAALERLCVGFSRPANAWTAWRVHARRAASPAPPEAAASACATIDIDAPVLVARNLRFAYPGRDEPVLSKLSLVLGRGERLLIEGASGSGKSTLAAVLAGARPASSGQLLASGLDRPTLGVEAWRRHTAAVPAYRENHIFAAPLSFNLLLGRQPPYTAADLCEAQAVCQDLGLGGLLARMPAGIHEPVGDSHWRLSQGEKSRIFLARALLQNAEIVILDEILSALDPENLTLCLSCLRRRAPTLIMMATADRDGP
jgi:ATP-binding cassette subfamily B protein